MKALETFTVILLYPDYSTDNYGQDTYTTCVEAADRDDAVLQAQLDCHANVPGIEDPDDLAELAVIKGEVEFL